MMQLLLTCASCSNVGWCYPTDTEIAIHGINAVKTIELSAKQGNYLTLGGQVVYLWPK